jgi:ABC-2 type transport system permease protein
MLQPFGAAASLRRVAAMVSRHWYLIRSSWPRILELIYWPMVQMLMWGFLQSYLAEKQGLGASIGGTLIGAVLLWDILFRGQIGFSMSFLEEMWSRNMGNLLMSPLRPWEFIIALMTVSIIRLMVGMVPVAIMAWLFFNFGVWTMGLGLALFFANLMITSWSVGLFITGLVLRHGMGAESLAWAIMFIMLPLACVYYPVEALPQALQYMAWALPPTAVFEGMRAILLEGVWRGDLMLWAAFVNMLLLLIGLVSFYHFLKAGRREGTLLQLGE